MLKLGGFNLRNFISNVPDATNALDPKNLESNSSLEKISKSHDQSTHVVSLKWDHVKIYLAIIRGIDPPLDKANTQSFVLIFPSLLIQLD